MTPETHFARSGRVDLAWGTGMSERVPEPSSLDGMADDVIAVSDPDQICDEVEDFVHGTRRGGMGDLAVRCAEAAVTAARELGLALRAGVHTAEVRCRGHAVLGLGVHVGARIAALAGDGEVCVSRTVRDLVLGAEVRFSSLGEHHLEGVPGRWEMLRLEEFAPRPGESGAAGVVSDP